jgi:hypothetical protein
LLCWPIEAFIDSSKLPMRSGKISRRCRADREVERAGARRLCLQEAEIDGTLEQIKALTDDHFGYAPDEINWSHIGSLEHYAQLLKRITDMAFKEGEHAE